MRCGRARKRGAKGPREAGPGRDAAFASVWPAAMSGRDALEIRCGK